MTKNLIIVESPTKTKTISKILGKDYKIMASKGHLRDLPKSRLGIDIENNFEPEYINKRGEGSLIKELKKEAQKAEHVYLATDPDREGEAISWHLGYLLGLDLNDNNRIVFSEITKKGILDGIKFPRKIDINLVNAQQGRRVIDRLMGYKISPILWKKISNGLSAGRVQSAALKLICDREREVQKFVPNEYHTITAYHEDFESQFYGKVKNNKVEKLELSTEEDTIAIIDKLSNEFILYDVKTKKRNVKPYAPYRTSTLQQDASRLLGFSSKKTMNLAQKLYEGVNIKDKGHIGLITYMRTDSVRLSNEFITECRKFIEETYGKTYLPDKANIYATGNNSQDAHEGIRPTSIYNTISELQPYLEPDMLKLYSLIWKRAVACQMQNNIQLLTSYILRDGDYEFRASGMQILFDGFRKIWNSTENTILLPALESGDKVKVLNIEDVQHFTSPPPRFSEASLIKELEENGVGRPSTYSQTINSILSRNYVIFNQKKLIPTELGFTVNDFLKQYFEKLVDVSFTAHIEKSFDDVAEGNKDWKALVDEFYTELESLLNKASKDDGNKFKKETKKVGRNCPKCGNELVYRNGKNGKFIGCSSFPNCDYTESIVDENSIKCPKCNKGYMLKKLSKKNFRHYYACSNYPECNHVVFDEPIRICDKCNGLILSKRSRNGKTTYCENDDCSNSIKNGGTN